MLPNIATFIIGLGQTGLSCARYLAKAGVSFAVVDSRDMPPGLDILRAEISEVPVYLGSLEQPVLLQAKQLIVSPGIAVNEPAIQKAKDNGAEIIGDVELFAREVKAPVIAITGTNGKSTVTALVAAMAEKAGKKMAMGGNIGTPVLDLLAMPVPDIYVIELSSFQLETTYSLKPLAATILNITPDHLDRYPSVTSYKNAKHRIYQQAKNAVYHRHDVLTEPTINIPNKINFGLSEPKSGEWGIREVDNQQWLAYGEENWLAVKQLKLVGRHNWENALAALALGRCAGFSKEAMLNVLKEFSGLPHRCQWVRSLHGVEWYNDSKATNEGAAIAALTGLGETISGKVIWLGGGQAKSDDFSELTPVLEKYAGHVLLFGEAAKILANYCPKSIAYETLATMQEAIQQAEKIAKPGDVVLLAPSCASFDQFKNFMHRGDVFVESVLAL